jgi:hypothetical protein
VTLAATATDPVGVASMAFERRATTGSTWFTICTDTTAPYSCAWTTTGVADGLWDLRATATDTLGHVSSSLIPSRTVDNTQPAPVDVQAGNGGSVAARPDVALGSDVVGADTTFDATMVQNGATITVTLGAKRGTNAVKTGAAAAMSWKVSNATTDLAGNAIVAGASVTESGAVDTDF